jgi:hypothetical protein
MWGEGRAPISFIVPVSAEQGEAPVQAQSNPSSSSVTSVVPDETGRDQKQEVE